MISNTDQSVDQEKYGENFDNIFRNPFKRLEQPELICPYCGRTRYFPKYKKWGDLFNCMCGNRSILDKFGDMRGNYIFRLEKPVGGVTKSNIS